MAEIAANQNAVLDKGFYELEGFPVLYQVPLPAHYIPGFYAVIKMFDVELQGILCAPGVFLPPVLDSLCPVVGAPLANGTAAPFVHAFHHYGR